MIETSRKAPGPLIARFGAGDLDLFDAEERKRFLDPFGPLADAALQGDEEAWHELAPDIATELLYRKEPDLYERLISGERIHRDVIEWLPSSVGTAVEVAAGTGRLTMDVAGRCHRLIAVEPVAQLSSSLGAKLDRSGVSNVEVRRGFFDEIPVPSDQADLVVSCSALTSDRWHGGEPGLAEMVRVAAPGGLIALVWPADVDWLRAQGFNYESFPGEMFVEFADAAEAAAIARIFYPHAVDEIVRLGLERVPYDLLGMNPPRDVAWKRVS
ncbi:MAG: class I SAM-dependent methyltransferase [Actinomycetota bacterium]